MFVLPETPAGTPVAEAVRFLVRRSPLENVAVTLDLTAGQHEVIAFLSAPGAFGPSGEAAERIDTHISVVWLVGERAYKLKRAVLFDYVDYSTSERRQVACQAEVRVNRRTAPSLYRGVRAVTREADGSLAIGGHGVPVDWLVEMERFDENTLFDRLAERQQLDVALMDELSDAVARLHATAERRGDHGGRAGMAWVVEGNAQGFAGESASVLGEAACQALTAQTRVALDRVAALLDSRRRLGFVRECHGDLHLRNICLVAGVPTLFDGVEFNDELSCIDVLYDLAFLLMDLWHRGLRSHANRVFNGYVASNVDLDGLALFPLFLSCRAAIRAKTSVSSAAIQTGADARVALEIAARQYLELAQRFLVPSPPTLVAVGGFSGSGKSTLARRLGPGLGAAPGALILRSDLIRKALVGVSPLTRLGPEAYSSVLTDQVYQTMADEASIALRAGQSVIADAVFPRAKYRDAIAAVARDLVVPFAGFWLDGPEELLARRIRDRVGDASDATAEVLGRQLGSDPGPIDWHRLDGSADAETIEKRAQDGVNFAC